MDKEEKMQHKINRRKFLSNSFFVAGGITLGGAGLPFFQTKVEKQTVSGTKKLFATTDFLDNVIINHRGSRYGTLVSRSQDYYDKYKCYMNRVQLDDLHKFLASIGVTRHQWIVDTIWTFYEDYPHGFDLLEEAAKSAHKYGIEFFAEIKPFEGGGFGPVLPHSMPITEGASAFKDLRGIFPRVRPFVAENPSMCLKCKEGSYESNTPISSIRLVKGDNKRTRIKATHLSLWTSPTNNGFVPYKGELSFSETVEKRYRFPYWRQCRILHFNNLDVPEGHQYFLIRCSVSDGEGDFSNEKGNILELVNAHGEIVPQTISTGPVRLEDHYESFYKSKIMRQLVRYLQMPEVQAEIDDLQKMRQHYQNYFGFEPYHTGEWTTLDKDGFIAAVCGKPEFMFGVLNPIYPEVQNHWLELTRFCLDRGVDGINYRISNHNNITDSHLYGFNQPVLDATKGKTDYYHISRANGNAYTFFLKEARGMIKKRGKKIVLHLHSKLLMPDERPLKLSALPPNFDWQWESWIKEIADELEFRGVFKLRPQNLDKALSIFGTAVKEADKSFYFQGDFHGLCWEKPYLSTESELEMVGDNTLLDGYVLYETANFTRINEKGEVEGSPELLKILKNKPQIQ